MAKHKMVPPDAKATDMVDERPLSHAEVAELEKKQQMTMLPQEGETNAKPSLHGRKSKVNMTMHTGLNLFKGQVPKLSDADHDELHKNFPGDAINKILEK